MYVNVLDKFYYFLRGTYFQWNAILQILWLTDVLAEKVSESL